MIPIHWGVNSILRYSSCQWCQVCGVNLRMNSAKLWPNNKSCVRCFVVSAQNLYKDHSPTPRIWRTTAISYTFFSPSINGKCQGLQDQALSQMHSLNLGRTWHTVSPSAHGFSITVIKTFTVSTNFQPHFRLLTLSKGRCPQEGKGPFEPCLCSCSCLRDGLSHSQLPGYSLPYTIADGSSLILLFFGLALWPADTVAFFSSSTT